MKKTTYKKVKGILTLKEEIAVVVTRGGVHLCWEDSLQPDYEVKVKIFDGISHHELTPELVSRFLEYHRLPK